jgi:DNA polymerase elongation subunit (family B)
MSFINREGGISFFQYDIPLEDLYIWKYAEAGDYADRDFVSWDSKPVKKVYQQNPNIKTQRIHEILMNLEAKNPELSCLHELNMPDISYCDIEVNVTDDGFPAAELADNQINTISWVNKNKVIVFGLCPLTPPVIDSIQKRIDEHCKKFKHTYEFEYRYYNTEVDMLNDFLRNYFYPSPCITGWNFLRYDWQYIFNRCRKLNLDITYLSPTGTWTKYSLIDMFNKGEKVKIDIPMHKFLFDYMEVYFKWDQVISPHESYKLDEVGEAAVGVRKVVHKLGFKDMWQKTPDDYVFYNAVDSILVREIDLKLKTATVLYSLANLMHCDVLTAFSPVNSLQVVQGEYRYKKNIIFPDVKRDIPNDSEGYEGAFVYEPKPGAYKNVIALDFASLYPTTMRQFNISPDTFLGKHQKGYRGTENEIVTCTGATYRKDVEGMLPEILTSFYNQRKAYKKEMQIALQEMNDLKDILEEREKKLAE